MIKAVKKGAFCLFIHITERKALEALYLRLHDEKGGRIMNFDFLNTTDFESKYRGELISNALKSEVYARIDPGASLAASRMVLEALIKGILEGHKETKRTYDPLYKMIDFCQEKGYISAEDHHKVVNSIRKNGNLGHHINSLNLRVPTEGNVELAFTVLKDLFALLKSHFSIDRDFDEDGVPFEGYEVIRKVKKSEREVIVGEYNYFVRAADGDEYYLQLVPRFGDEDEMALVRRSEEARVAIKESFFAPRYYHITNMDIIDAPFRIVLYPVKKDSFLLSENKKVFSKKDLLDIGLGIVRALKELKEARQGIYHRNINPGCVVIVPFNGMYYAVPVNLQTAKIQNSDLTVMPQINLNNNSYIPEDVWGMKTEDVLRVDWEKVEVYSVAKTVLYAFDPKLAIDKVPTSKALAQMSRKGYSVDFLDFFKNILDGDHSNNPSLDEMEQVFLDELK